MDFNEPETWRWIWLITALVFAVGEITVAGSFFLAPFAIGAALAAILAFAGVDLNIEWVVFLAVSAGSFLFLRPIMRRLDSDGPMVGVGSSRQVGQRGRVVEAIDGEHDHGTVMLGPERWRADTADGTPIPVGATVEVIEVRGTRLVVAAASAEDDAQAEPPADTVR